MCITLVGTINSVLRTFADCLAFYKIVISLLLTTVSLTLVLFVCVIIFTTKLYETRCNQAGGKVLYQSPTLTAIIKLSKHGNWLILIRCDVAWI